MLSFPPSFLIADSGDPTTAAFLKVVECILDGLKRKVVSTKRDIFYRSVALFVKQQLVDSVRARAPQLRIIVLLDRALFP